MYNMLTINMLTICITLTIILNMYNKTSQRSLLMTSFDCTPKKIAKAS